MFFVKWWESQYFEAIDDIHRSKRYIHRFSQTRGEMRFISIDFVIEMPCFIEKCKKYRFFFTVQYWKALG